MSIRLKLIVSASISVLGLGVLVLMLNFSLNSLSKLDNAKEKIEELKSDMLMLRRNEKDFLLRKDLKYKNKFEKNVTALHKDSRDLINILNDKGIDSSKIKKFDVIIDAYKKEFFTLISKQKEIGLNSKDGLYGSLRNSVHIIQDSAKQSNNHKLLSSVYDLRKQEKDFMLRRDLKYVTKFEQKIDALLSKMSGDENTNNRIKYLLSYKKDFLTLVESEVEIGLSSKLGLQGNMRKIVHTSESLLENLSSGFEVVIAQEISKMKMQSLIIGISIMLLVIILAYVLSKNIIKSLNDFQKDLLGFFKYLNNETTTVKLLKSDSNDEIGTMSKVVNKNIETTRVLIEDNNRFLNEVQSMIEKVSEGYLYHRFKNEVKSENLETLRISFNQMLDGLQGNIAGSTNKILDVLVSFGKLDFTNNVKNDEGKIALALNEVSTLITSMLIENKSNGLTLQNSSNTLLENVEVLNTNSNETAAALEQTAASLEEITGNIRGNTQNIAKMASYSNELSTSSSQGQSLASKTSIAMDEIKEQVMAISEAIGLIDQIAFQTNILSLNAAVEAATAGEAGKGFAVVAAEVRNLASRSAQAAQEIKSLVENANNKANEGKEISTDMIEGYSALNKNIKNTLELISDVETASNEQLSGIEQINDAVNLLDQQTQQNVSIASTTKEIAKQTDEIATLIVSNADDKNFKGKENVEAKGINKKKKQETKQYKINLNNIKKTKHTANMSSYSKNNTDEEWESF